MEILGWILAAMVVGILLDSFVLKFSTQKMIGLDLSIKQSGVIVLLKSLGMMCAGFLVGTIIKLWLSDDLSGLNKLVDAGAVLLAALVSFGVYYLAFLKISGRKVNSWGVIKTILMENVLVWFFILIMLLFFLLLANFNV